MCSGNFNFLLQLCPARLQTFLKPSYVSEPKEYIKLTSASLSSVHLSHFGKYAIDGVIPGNLAHSKCTTKGMQWLKISFDSPSCVKVRSVFNNKNYILR